MNPLAALPNEAVGPAPSCCAWCASVEAGGPESDAKGCLQKSLDWMGYKTDKAVSRARGQSRQGRKRTRSEGPAGMDVDGVGDGDMDMEPPQKRIHSSKSRCSLLLSASAQPNQMFRHFQM